MVKLLFRDFVNPRS